MDTFLTKGQYATYAKNISLTDSCYHFCKGKVMMFFLRKLDIFTVGGICKIVYLSIFCCVFFLTGNSFQHGNYLSSNDQFLDSLDDAGFIFVSSEVKVGL